jgi:two-component system sensor histidine kinase YesM
MAGDRHRPDGLRPRIGLRNSVSLQLIVTFVGIMVPVCVLGLLGTQRSIATLRGEVAASMEARARFLMTFLEREIAHVQEMEQGLASDDDLNRLAAIPASLDIIATFEALARLQQRLRALATSSQLIDIDGVSIHLKAMGRTLLVRGIDPLTPSEFARLGSQDPSVPSGLTWLDGRILARIVYPWQGSSGAPLATFIVDIEISPARIEQVLAALRDSRTDGFLLVDRATKGVIVGEPPAADRTSFLERASAERSWSFDAPGGRRLAVSVPSESLGMTLVYYRSERALLFRVRGQYAWLFALAVVSLGVILGFAVSIYGTLHRPVHDLVAAFQRLQAGDFEVRIGHAGSREFGYLFAAFDQMTARLKELIDQSYQKTILIQKAELKQLQSQINPHFLYNTFFMLYSLAHAEGAATVAELTRRLGTYYRFVTRSVDDEVPLAREVEHARVYADIQEMRAGDRIRVEFDAVPPVFADLPVPRLILQPLIENAIEHGLAGRAEQAWLAVKFIAGDRDLVITVEDNGTGIDDRTLSEVFACLEHGSPDGGHTALANIHRRLRLRFGSCSGLSLERRPAGGVLVTIRIAVEAPCSGS